MKKKSWNDKLQNSKDLPKVIELDNDAAERWGGRSMTIPAPLEIDEIMRNVPKGKLITINEIRQKVAQKHNSDIACPLTTGIFSWIVANAAEESREMGNAEITPYWRTLKTGGYLNEKYPGGIEQQKTFLENEDHKVTQEGKKWIVDNYESKLVSSK